ncbi:MAG: AMP-binding protein [Deltaproteobacteria bacterium]|nr:AMP-binding protein [Deltaproteobacteria bacterium]
MNLYQLFAETAQKRTDKPAIVFEEEAITFAQLPQRVARYAASLARLGVTPGDRVAIQLGKCKEFVFLHLANLSLGGVTLPLNSDYKPEEVQYFLSDSGAALFVTDQNRYLNHRPALDALNVKSAIVDGSSREAVLGLPEVRPAAERGFSDVYPRHDDDLALICYTSGTTGRSKGAMITHGNLISNMLDLQEVWRWNDRDVLLHVLPLFHIHGLVVALHGSLNAGSTSVIHERFDPARTWRALERGRCTLLMGVPTMYQRLVAYWKKMEPRPDLSAIRLFISGSAPLSTELFHRFESATGFRILERYGMTETGMIASNPYEPEGARKPGSVGFALPRVRMRIAGSDGTEAKPGDVGEVQLQGPNVCRGYWGMPEKTREAFTDGWFRTGDLGYQDPADGMRLYLVGRGKELIISGGYNVYPKEIEAVLDAHPAVLESAVLGVPDQDLGEQVVAFVVPRSGHELPSGNALIAHCKAKLAGYKCPKKVLTIEELPRNTMGKIQKDVLAGAVL